ncbi:MAG: hypothetical protein RL236_1806, partial [Pseudomonadota bacterium]
HKILQDKCKRLFFLQKILHMNTTPKTISFKSNFNACDYLSFNPTINYNAPILIAGIITKLLPIC